MGTLEEYCRWVFGLPSGHPDDPLRDANGDAVKKFNENRNVWILPGTPGEVQLTTRKIEVNHSKSLFVVVGSDHATPTEVGSGNQPQLEDWVNAIRGYWTKVEILYGYDPDPTKRTKETENDLQLVKGGLTDLYIDPKNYYATKHGPINPNPGPMASSAYVKEFTDLKPNVKPFYILLDADSRASNKGESPEEGPYHVKVEYEVKVN